MNQIQSHANEMTASEAGVISDIIRLKGMVKSSKAMFKWYNGPLIQSMYEGTYFLIDEISLADDSVLERLNSLLEPARSICLVENQAQVIQAHPDFRIFATMNPGGDYGKKELSPALRNRFTEIYCRVFSTEDLRLILTSRLNFHDSSKWADLILKFLTWFASSLAKPLEEIISLRDILAWVNFMNLYKNDAGFGFQHGCRMVLLDGLETNPLFGSVKVQTSACEDYLESLCEYSMPSSQLLTYFDSRFGNQDFSIACGPEAISSPTFNLEAPTTLLNASRVLRAMQISKPILLEGSPGVGKTSLVISLAKLTGHSLVRINLSEQTDLMDLFGSDMPMENSIQFAWHDGPLLHAIKNGYWVVLDELNLASQQVLEGLNAILDHRRQVYIPEIDQSFDAHPSFRVFACQNPQKQGGGRKGLPKSFVNRFSQVYMATLTGQDLEMICQSVSPNHDQEIIGKMIQVNEEISSAIHRMEFGQTGAPWEFNLRDVMRWITLTNNDPGKFFKMIYLDRMRTRKDRICMITIYERIFSKLPADLLDSPMCRVTENFSIIGDLVIERKYNRSLFREMIDMSYLHLVPSVLGTLESLMHAVKTHATPLIVGPSCGKTSLVRLASLMCGERLVEFSMNPEMDALELLGGFEQMDPARHLRDIVDTIDFNSRKFLYEYFQHGEYKAEYILQLLTEACLYSTAIPDIEVPENIKVLFRLLVTIVQQPQIIMDQFTDVQHTLQQFLPSEIMKELENRRTEILNKPQGFFEWVDSPLLCALEQGHWLLLDNVNLCTSSVLDRLNSLLEVDGCLSVNERGIVDGQVKRVVPHPNFRLFMCMNPANGEISRAMRNRTVELYLDDFKEADMVKLNRMYVVNNWVPSEYAHHIINVWSKAQSQIAQISSREGTIEATPYLLPRIPNSTNLFSHAGQHNLESDMVIFNHLINSPNPIKFFTFDIPDVSNSILNEVILLALRCSSASDLTFTLSYIGERLSKTNFSEHLDEFIYAIEKVQDILVQMSAVTTGFLASNGIHSNTASMVITIFTQPIDFELYFRDAPEEIVKLSSSFKIMVSFFRFQFQRKQAYSHSQSTVDDSQNFAEQSYLFFTKRIRRVTGYVEPLYALIESFESICVSYVSGNKFEPATDLLKDMQHLWTAANTSDLPYLASVVMKIADKKIPLYGLPQLCKSLSLGKIKQSMQIYQSSSILGLTANVFPISEVFQCLNRLMDVTQTFDFLGGAALKRASIEMKKNVYQGVATLHYISAHPDDQLLNTLSLIPNEMSNLDSSMNASKLASIAGIQDRLGQMLLWPYHDVEVVCMTRDVIISLSNSMVK